MRIKQLELTGFKSFPQRTALDIPSGVTAVVGPNGCGKSNIVDAIRWVLGEQSAKQLRGDAMEAVVFNGNERLAPLGMAEVSLTFQNDTDRPPPTDLDLEVSSVPAHLRSLPEITVTRRYFRSGESEYCINKIPCRLKDITELFLGTGVGSKAYAIIEQGRVEQLINAKPEDRRLFIEEAAGTTLYRSRKLAAERKMERTRENLARVNDVLREIDRQIEYLARQAKKAETHRRLSAEVRDLEIAVTTRQWRSLGQQLSESEAAHERLAAREREVREAIEARAEARRKAAADVLEAEQQQAARRESLAVLDAEAASVRERIALLERERAERERRAARLREELTAAARARQDAGERLSTAERERDLAGESLSIDDENLRERERELGDARVSLSEIHERLDAAKAARIDHATREADLRNRVSALDRRLEDLRRQIEKLDREHEAETARLLEIDRQVAARRADLTSLRAELAAANEAQQAHTARLRELTVERLRCERAAAELEGALLQARSRLESLEQIRRDYEGFNRGVRALMRTEHHAEGVLGVVADVIDTPQEYERAVAAVLGDRLQYMIVEGEEHGAFAVDRLRREASGRGSFIPLHPRHVATNGAASFNGTSKRLLDVVQVDDAYRGVVETLLGEVVLVPDLGQAVSLWRRNGVHVTFVTPDGDVLDPAGVITGGSDEPIAEEILARRREIEGLRAGAEKAESELAAARDGLEGIMAAFAEAEARLHVLGEGSQDLAVRIVAVEKDIERLEMERPQCVSRREVARYERGACAEDESAVAAERSDLHAQLAALETERGVLDEKLQQERAAGEQAAADAERLAIELTAGKVRFAERRERHQALLAQVESLSSRVADLDQRSATLADDLDQVERERADLETGIAASRERETEQAARRVTLEEAVEAARLDLESKRAVLREEEERGRTEDDLLERVREERSQNELARSEIRIRAEHLVAAMREKYECDIGEIGEIGAAADAEEGASTEALAEETARLEDLKTRLARIGDVNLAAIDELRELEERGGFLRGQRDDLERSLADLQRTIQKLNRASRARFAETFARANETFQKVLPRLFRGGEGRLVLTNEDDLLESGVEIVARPPGKRLDSVSLMSGGEKALVAVSLIFSLFLINPTPFCILDEVDAPLDDANIGRFGQMIREMSEHSQFILITHNKRTMEAAQVLYGVTMQEPGVSKVISVAMS
jgi:chromosome segregation protein